MIKKPHGKFIAFEGVDYAGKTDKINYLQETLAGQNVLFTKEPGGTKNGLLFRELLLKGAPDQSEPWDWKTQILLFFTDRNQHLNWKIAPARELGTHVITDRFRASSLAYNVPEDDAESLEAYRMLSRFVVGDREPTLYIYLDLPMEVALARAQDRLEQQNHFDTASLEVYAKRHRMYRPRPRLYYRCEPSCRGSSCRCARCGSASHCLLAKKAPDVGCFSLWWVML
jgi:dTMP kinase